jgi:nucleotide-binding universal stress UspA family protein
MACIVCATRGGAGSRAVQERAIKYAQQRECDLTFLFVVDMSGMDEADDKLKRAVKEELYWLGQTLLQIAQRRAKNENISSEVVIREGNVQDEIRRYLRESSATTLLLGAPRGTTTSRFGDDYVEQMANDIQDQSGVPVEIVRPQEV